MGTRGFDLFGRALWSFSTMGVYPSFFFSLLLATWLGGQETHCKALSKVGAFFQGECLAWSWSSVTGYKCDQELNTDPVDLDKVQARLSGCAQQLQSKARSGRSQDQRRAQCSSIGMAAQEQAQGAVDNWYSEIKDYTYGKEPSTGGSEIGHFTQVVWKGSTEVGVGVAQEGSTVVVVANYSPPGNVRGQYAENVPPPQ